MNVYTRILNHPTCTDLFLSGLNPWQPAFHSQLWSSCNLLGIMLCSIGLHNAVHVHYISAKLRMTDRFLCVTLSSRVEVWQRRRLEHIQDLTGQTTCCKRLEFRQSWENGLTQPLFSHNISNDWKPACLFISYYGPVVYFSSILSVPVAWCGNFTVF